MNNDGLTIGIDNRDGVYYVARVDNQQGRPDIKALIRIDADHFNGHHLLEGNRIVVALPDDQVIVKQFRLQSTENIDLKIKFELETAMLDNTDKFLYDCIPTQLENYYLGLSIRKELATQITEPFLKQNGDVKFSTSGVMRAAALANGFLTYCQQSGGQFGAIVDFGEKSASIAFYYKQQIIDLDCLPLEKNYYQSDDSFQNLIIELKTLLNFKLSALLEKGISIPLSKLFLIGETISETQLETLSSNLKIDICRPEIHAGFITDREKALEIPLDKYLVALGLTVL